MADLKISDKEHVDTFEFYYKEMQEFLKEIFEEFRQASIRIFYLREEV